MNSPERSDARVRPLIARTTPPLQSVNLSAYSVGPLLGRRQGPASCDDVYYAPVTPVGALDQWALANAALSLEHMSYDFVVVSRSLDEVPFVSGPPESRQSIVFRERAAPWLLRGDSPSEPLCGRVVRMPGHDGANNVMTLDAILPDSRVNADGDVVVGLGQAHTTLRAAQRPVPTLESSAGNQREVVFVWPAQWAVGGVERLAVEVMRQQAARYRFVVVTTERLTASQGSLHSELRRLGVAFYDLAELAPPSTHLSMLSDLKQAYRPVAVWLCNGSPWLCDHAADLRQLYWDTPIVSQIAYDTEAGWIARCGEPGILTFDRHVAINSGIRRVFTEDIGIEPDHVDLIYHGYDEERFDLARYSSQQRAALRQKFGVGTDERVFVFPARMTAQKRPLDFIDLALSYRSDTSARFLMLGDGELAVAVDEAIQRSGLTTIERRPFQVEVAEIFAIADALVITSAYEGLPIAMLEALAMGVPVFSTDVGDVGLVLERFGAGQVVSASDDIQTRRAAFLAFCNDLPRFRSAAVESSKQVRREFGGARVASEYANCWQRAVTDRTTSI